MRTWSTVPGVPAAGHVTASGFWHSGAASTCQKCSTPLAPPRHAARVAWDRPETDPCERGTVGCSVLHGNADTACDTW